MAYAFEHILSSCLPSGSTHIFLLFDRTTADLVKMVSSAAVNTNKILQCAEIPCGRRHGEEPPADVVEKMIRTDAVLCMTKYSLAHTAARMQTEKRGIPFLSMPDYNADMLKNPALMADYKKLYPSVRRYADMLTESRMIAVSSDKGTELFMDVSGRKGNCCPGWTDKTYLLGSPPDIEANISPIETYTHGVIVVDGSITDSRIGILSVPVYLYVTNGAVNKIECPDKQIEKKTRELFESAGSPNAYIVGELGIGFNDKAFLCGNMLVDEGAKGCIHFGLGSNWTIGGQNKTGFHLDFVVRKATVALDQKIVIEKGELLYE